VKKHARANSQTKQQIIEAAEKVMSQKGLKASTITEIASLAQINDSVIYHYFKNKDDLLFSVTENHLVNVIATLNDQLAGIPDPFSRLSKMVWFHLHYNLSHWDYSLLLLFECRSNIKFYQHKAYERIRDYSDIMLAILHDGVSSGAFKQDLNPELVRDLILGATDWISIKHIVDEDRSDVMPEVNKLMEAVGMMINAREEPDKQKPDKRTVLLNAAEKAFALKGFAAATIADIAKEAKVAEGTIYEYFKNKNDLLMSIPKDRFKQHQERLQELFIIKSTPRKLRRFMRYHFMLYQTQPDFLRVFLFNIQMNPDFYKSESYEEFQQYIQIVDQILTEGMQEGSFYQDCDIEVFKSLFFGGFNHVTLRWYVSKTKMELSKMEQINDVVDLLMSTVLEPKQKTG
jgi:AcrR family transcriptional regulator